MTKPKPKPVPGEECRGRVRYPSLDGAQVALTALRGTTWGGTEPRQCKVCEGYHLAPPKSAKRRAA